MLHPRVSDLDGVRICISAESFAQERLLGPRTYKHAEFSKESFGRTVWSTLSNYII